MTMFDDSPEEILCFDDRQPTKAAAKSRPCPGPEFCEPDRDRPWICRLCDRMIHLHFLDD